MRKTFAHTVLILTLTMLLMSCMTEPAEPVTPPTIVPATVPALEPAAVPSTEPMAAETPAEDTLPAENPSVSATMAPESEEPQGTAAAVETAESLPYLQPIDRADQSIYTGPGYDYGFAGTVRERGIYTIVEEEVDYEGNLWGRLKSGVGWVDLTEIRSEEYSSALISANYACENLLLHGAYHHYSDNQEYRIPIAIRAYGRIRDVALCKMEFNAGGCFPGEDLFTLTEMTEELPLVAELAFPGDMSTYGIRFADEDGNTHSYIIYISGRNGALMLTEES